MKTRWGSCNHKKGYINLNLRLLEKNLRAIEYVILHELSHIKFPNHSKEFYDFIHSFMSDFRQREKEF
ncbi:M48 family metallopeptidase, partial [Campylobacter coli]|nr:M48 family metallopeptidase [Campylobacter coli]